MTTHESPARREARCKVVALVLGATPEQLDQWRDRESREGFRDWMLRLARKEPFVALAVLGG